MSDSLFVLQVHHGGYFVESPKMYLGGKFDCIRDVDPDFMSYFEVLGLIKDLGCEPQNATIFHKMPDSDLDGGLREIKTDRDVVDMFVIHGGRPTIPIYVEGMGVPLDVDDEKGDGSESEEEDNGSEFSQSTERSINGSDLEYFADGDEIIESTGLLPSSAIVSVNGIGSGSSGSGNGIGSGVDEVEYDDWDFLSEMQSLDDGDRAGQFIEFFEERDMERPQLKVGMLFANAGVFRAALRKYAIQNGTEFTYVKNEGSRVTAICKNKCGWRIHASYFQDTTSYQIKSLRSHPCQCPRQYRVRHATSNWLSQTYLDRLRDDPTWKLSAIKKAAKRDHMLDVSNYQVYRAKRKALETIEGNHRQQYWKLWDYCEMIRRTNPGSTALLKVERFGANPAPVFQRMFVVFEAQARGFVQGCRPIIGLDACHLKGPFLGQLMHAVGKDANDQMYPIAIAIVEAELKDSWMWFMENLLQVIGRTEEHGWTFISDRQKGLVETFKQLMPSADHRFCVRHMYANFKNQFKGKDLKDLVWGAACSYTVQEWESKMKMIKTLNKDAHAWLMRESPTTWTRAMFSPRAKCDMLANNISESFNHYIKDARDKPIITMVEMIRRQLMSRFEEKRSWIAKQDGLICPKIFKNIDKLKEKARSFEVTYAGSNIFEVRDAQRTFVVGLGTHTCTCRKWDLTGIPCSHAMAAIMQDRRLPEIFVDPYYHKDTYKLSYASIINPIPDDTQWVHMDLEAIHAPTLRRPPGRPKKARRRASDEPPKNPHLAARAYQSLRCGNCQQLGHNSRTCKGPVAPKWKRNAVSGRGEASRGRGEASRGRGRGRGRGMGRGMGRGRGRSTTPNPGNQSSSITSTLVNSTPTSGITLVSRTPTSGIASTLLKGKGVNRTTGQKMQKKSTTYGDVYFSAGDGPSQGSSTAAILSKFGPSQGSSNKPPTQG